VEVVPSGMIPNLFLCIGSVLGNLMQLRIGMNALCHIRLNYFELGMERVLHMLGFSPNVNMYRMKGLFCLTLVI
jgi:hypothetical protein